MVGRRDLISLGVLGVLLSIVIVLAIAYTLGNSQPQEQDPSCVQSDITTGHTRVIVIGRVATIIDAKLGNGEEGTCISYWR